MNSIYKIFFLCGVVLLSSCASLPTDYKATPSTVFHDTSNTQLGERSSSLLGKDTTLSSMTLINEGTDAFVARMAILDAAEKSVDVQYYIWHADLIGKLLLNKMIAAADRGVRVRVLLDDMPISAELESMLYAMDQHDKIEVRLYNPFSARSFHLENYLLEPSRINRRMHNKSFTVDNQITVVGGRNIGNEYFSADEVSNFSDIDVISVGPVVKDVGKQFDIYWNSNVVFTVKAFSHNDATESDLNDLRKGLTQFKDSKQDSKYALDIQDSDMYRRIIDSSYNSANPIKTFRGEVNVVYDDPEKSLGKSEHEIVYLKSLMRPYLDDVENTFEIVSPYFVPGEEGTNYLSSLVSKGITVRVITNSLSSTDGLMAQSGYSRNREALLKGGIELYELKADSKTKASRSLRRGGKAKSGLHAKTYIFDRNNVFIGSFNFDPRSANINAEVGIVYEIPEMASLIGSSIFGEKLTEHTYKVIFENENNDDIIWVETTKDGKKIHHTKDPQTSWWRRFNESIFSILPIESQL